MRERALEEFAQTWKDYSSPTEAARSIARSMGVGKTTLVDWARADGIWPTTRATRVLALEKEIRRLRAALGEVEHG